MPPPPTLCRQRRTELQLTQDALAALCGVPQPYISLIERRKPIPFPEDMVKVAEALGVAPELLAEAPMKITDVEAE